MNPSDCRISIDDCRLTILDAVMLSEAKHLSSPQSSIGNRQSAIIYRL